MRTETMSVAAYRQSMRDTVSPRQLEHRVFSQVTAELEVCTRQPDAFATIRAVDRNRRLWGALVTDLAQPDNLLPDALKAGLISLGLWVNRYSSEVLTEGRPLNPLIEVNRTVMQGLGSAPAGAA
ncbi:flagellar protein FlaF, putative [Rhodospirillum centenum SW]|uniref:Flagellar protein FlaF, putative n=2 Tax=Rhodospirillum centenum TaxID=34018 RepID=B6IQB7_RHOCS|nr:flagellar protein FlaF, putative [Rhodospirillum centenum SW]